MVSRKNVFCTATQQNGCQCKLMALVKAVHNRDHTAVSCGALAHGAQRDLCISNRACAMSLFSYTTKCASVNNSNVAMQYIWKTL